MGSYFFEDRADVLVGLGGCTGFGEGGGDVGVDLVVGEVGGFGFDDLEGSVWRSEIGSGMARY